MMAAEIGQRRPVDDRARAGAELALEDGVRVGAGDRVHGVEAHAKAGGEQRADRVEIEQRPHQRGVVRSTGSTISTVAPPTMVSPIVSRSTSGASDDLDSGR